MIRIVSMLLAIALCLIPVTAPAELAGTVSDDYEPLYTFAEPYGFRLGGAFGFPDLYNTVFMDFLDDHFNSLTCTNETKAYSLLNQGMSKRSDDGMPRMDYTNADKMVEWCQKHGKGVRGHVLVWDAYMTKWFFHEDYDERKPLADKETMRARLKSYIAQVITHYLKLGTLKEQLEREKLEKENELLKAKTEAIQSAQRVEELYSNALEAMRRYSGDSDEY